MSEQGWTFTNRKVNLDSDSIPTEDFVTTNVIARFPEYDRDIWQVVFAADMRYATAYYSDGHKVTVPVEAEA